MHIGHIQGGTHAGWKRQLPAREAWNCVACGLRNKPYLTQCSGCGARHG